jgi:hypothetical protein
LVAVSSLPYTLTGSFLRRVDGTSFTLTNVYAPTDRAEKPSFLSELSSVAKTVTGAWMLLGDFNLTRVPSDKNTTNFNSTDANNFNDLINTLGLIEIPLVDRAYTWSNRRDDPTLVRLDRCFVKIDWDSTFPNTSLRSLTRSASDHAPLVSHRRHSCSTQLMLSLRELLAAPSFVPLLIISVLDEHVAGSVANSFIRRLKHCRRVCRAWSRQLSPIDVRENDTKVLVNALDLLEEQRPLHPAEADLRRRAIQSLQDIHSEKLAFWRQRFHIRLALEWDENSCFFHAAASGRRRQNAIACLEHDGVATCSHDAKSTILYNFYSDLLGRARDTAWHFDLKTLYPHLTVCSDSLSGPFTISEITRALFSMDTHASPGPDGFLSFVLQTVLAGA